MTQAQNFATAPDLFGALITGLSRIGFERNANRGNYVKSRLRVTIKSDCVMLSVFRPDRQMSGYIAVNIRVEFLNVNKFIDRIIEIESTLNNYETQFESLLTDKFPGGRLLHYNGFIESSNKNVAIWVTNAGGPEFNEWEVVIANASSSFTSAAAARSTVVTFQTATPRLHPPIYSMDYIHHTRLIIGELDYETAKASAKLKKLEHAVYFRFNLRVILAVIDDRIFVCESRGEQYHAIGLHFDLKLYDDEIRQLINECEND